jgi:hypothetical protein
VLLIGRRVALKKERFESIDVEKLNIVDKDGTVKMTLFNRAVGSGTD